jgi:hypothetical protein
MSEPPHLLSIEHLTLISQKAITHICPFYPKRKTIDLTAV